MPNIETFVQKEFVQRRNWLAYIVFTDGMHKAARAYNCQVRRETTEDTLEEVHNEEARVVDSVVSSNRLRVQLGFREIVSPTLQNLFFGSGVAPTINARDSLLLWQQWGQLLRDDRASGDPAEFRLEMASGLPQAFNATKFPAPANPDLSHTAETGTFAADTYYGWAVPMFVDKDAKHGYGSLTCAQILTNLATWERGVHYVFGTPSASDELVLGAEGGMTMAWDEVATGPIPTHYAVVIGTADDITDAGSKIAAVVEWGTTTAVLSAAGSTAFGTTPALADLYNCQLGTVPAATRVWTTKTEDTDYTYDKTTGIWKRIDGGAIAAGAPVRINQWYFADPYFEQDDGSGVTTQLYHWLRFINLLPKDTDPDTDRPRGVIIDMPRVQMARREGDLLTTGEDGYHGPVQVNLTAEYSQAQGYAVHIRGFHDEFEELLDYYSSDISAAA